MFNKEKSNHRLLRDESWRSFINVTLKPMQSHLSTHNRHSHGQLKASVHAHREIFMCERREQERKKVSCVQKYDAHNLATEVMMNRH